MSQSTQASNEGGVQSTWIDSSPSAHAPFSESQIVARALIAEINLLLDFVSGRSDRILGGGQQLRLPKGYNDHNSALTHFFEIRTKLEDESQVSVPAHSPIAAAE